MSLDTLLEHLDKSMPLYPGSDLYSCMTEHSQEALRITMRLNGSYHTPEEIIQLMSELTGKPVDASFRMFPPFHTDFGKNITFGKNVFINACCCFQDQGGITIGDGTFIGHKVVLATLNHGFMPEDRGTTYPSPITIGKNAWIGSGATILPGVNIGDNVVIAAGAMVSNDVEPNTIVGGVPARFIKNVDEAAQKQRQGPLAVF